MAALASVNVSLDVRVTVSLRAENATDAELAAHVGRCPEDVKGAILAALERGFDKSAGWLDDEREVFAVEVVGADTLTLTARGPLGSMIVADVMPVVVA